MERAVIPAEVMDVEVTAVTKKIPLAITQVEFFYLMRKHSFFDFEMYISPATDRIIKSPATNWEIPNTLGIKYRIYRVLRIPSSASLPTEYHSI